jgi:RimJ/RimL family protein N-acetyltransferase
MVMHTKRLVLRELTDDDFDSLYAVLGDSDII